MTKTRSLDPLREGFHGDRYLLRLVAELARRAESFIETGSNVGSTLGYVARTYPELTCLSCEPDLDAFRVAREHACVRAGVSIFPELSQDFLERLARDHEHLFERPVLAWLDAHDYGFEWPLRDEVAFLTGRFRSGFVLVDDFQVPHDARFGWDSYDGRNCSFEYIRAAIDPQVAWRLYYPSYSEHTSPWHPLRGWGLLQFAATTAELERFDERLPDVCTLGASSDDSPHATALEPQNAASQPVAQALRDGDLRRAEALLRAELAAAPESAPLWNDLGTCLAQLGLGEESLAALREALRFDPGCADARANLKLITHAMQPEGEAPLPVAPGAWGRMVQRDPYDDLRALVDSEDVLIVDGGANRGDTVARLRRRFPRAMIHAFEPIPALASHVRERFAADERLVVHRAALAAQDGRLTFGVRRSDATSSALEPSALKRRYLGAEVELDEEIDVLALRLDGAVPETIDVLKLDLQGYELQALLGLGPRLSQVRVLLTEVEFVPLYEGQPLFGDLDVRLREAGFRLFHLYDIWSHADGQVTSGDALYVNERFFS